MLYLSLVFFVIFLVFFALLVYWKLIYHGKRIYRVFRNQHVPGEPFVPILGQLPAIYRAIQNDTLTEFIVELIEKHGYYFLVSFGPHPRLFVMEPDLIADILSRSHINDYIKPTESITILKPIIGSKNLLLSEGHDHDRARKMINPAFYSDNLKELISIIAEQTRQTLDEFLSNTDDQKTIDLQKEFSALTLSVITSSAFGKGLKMIPEILTKIFAAIEYRSLRMINQIPFLAKLPICQKHIIDQGAQDIVQLVEQILADRRQGRTESLSSNKDLLDLLLSATDDQGDSFSDQEIKDQALTFVVAGHETTANLMTWVAYILMTNNDVLRACQEEIDRVLPNSAQFTYEYLSQLNICEAVIQETLRLYPPAPFLARECIREHTIGKEGDQQLTIPEKATIIINVYELHRRADFWPRPLEFDYKRWIRDPVTGLKPKLAHPYCYLPFSAGPRNCIGQNFALLEAKIILASLIQRCHLQLEAGQKLSPNLMMSMRCKHGMTAQISNRRSP